MDDDILWRLELLALPLFVVGFVHTVVYESDQPTTLRVTWSRGFTDSRSSGSGLFLGTGQWVATVSEGASATAGMPQRRTRVLWSSAVIGVLKPACCDAPTRLHSRGCLPLASHFARLTNGGFALGSNGFQQQIAAK